MQEYQNVMQSIEHSDNVIEQRRKIVDEFCNEAKQDTLDLYNFIFRDLIQKYNDRMCYSTKEEIENLLDNSNSLLCTDIKIHTTDYRYSHGIDLEKGWNNSNDLEKFFLYNRDNCSFKKENRYGYYYGGHIKFLTDILLLQELFQNRKFDFEIMNIGDNEVDCKVSIDIIKFSYLLNLIKQEFEQEKDHQK